MHALVPKRHREYEMVYVLAPTTTPGGATKVSEIINEAMSGHDGKVLKVDLWGIRTLAYRIKGQKQGIYYYMKFLGTQGLVEEMERRLRITESVLRFLTVKLSDRVVDPAAYTVSEEEAAFKPIDDLVAGLEQEAASEQAGEEDEEERESDGDDGGDDEKKQPDADDDDGDDEEKKDSDGDDGGDDEKKQPDADDDEPELEVATDGEDEKPEEEKKD